MSYNRGTLGYQKWGVTNPWVFANYGQPQRKRGYVSPMVFQTAGPFLKSAHLGDTETARAERMEKIAIAGLAMSAASLWLGYNFYKRSKQPVRNRGRRRRRRRTSR